MDCREEEGAYFYGQKRVMELDVIRKRIYEIRGQRVMLDRDLAELYNVSTSALNQAVRRNIERFPKDFMFQLSDDEVDNWKSQIVISNSVKMGLRRNPYAFTEEGVAMLSAVLKSSVAVQVCVSIMRAFVMMRNYVSSVVSPPTEFSEFKERLQMIEQSCKDNADAVSELGEDVIKKVPPARMAPFSCYKVFCYLANFLASAFWLNLYINGVATNIDE